MGCMMTEATEEEREGAIRRERASEHGSGVDYKQGRSE